MLSFIDEFCEDCEPEDSFSQISSSFQPRYNSQNWYPFRWVFSYRIGSCTDRCAGRAAVAFWTLQQPSKIKIKQRERSVLENGLKTCPTDEFSPSWEKAYNGVAYKPCVCTLVKKFFPAPNFCLFYYRLLLKKQSTKIKKHFEFLSVNASRTTANDQTERDTRQWGGGYTSTDVFQHSAQF